MKKIFTLIVALVATITTMNAQNHGVMNFVGSSTFYVVGMQETTTTQVANDKVTLTLVGTGSKQAEIVIPDMDYDLNGNLMQLKSFTANSGVEYTMTGSYQTGDMAFEWAEGEFATTTIGADNNQKAVAGKISAKYIHSTKKLEVSAEFTYGAMPWPIHYQIEADYVKESAIAGVSEDFQSLDSQAPAFNMAGQRVNANAKGLVIIGGVKVIR